MKTKTYRSGFWQWFCVGTNTAKPGIRRFADIWFLLHLAVGIGCAVIVPESLQRAANTVLLPLAGIFVGLSFAWGGNIQALLQTAEVKDLVKHHPGGFDDYLFVFQAAILVILTTLAVWGLAGLGVFDQVWPTPEYELCYRAVASFLYLMASLTLRECWHVVLGAQMLLKARHDIAEQRRGGESPQD